MKRPATTRNVGERLSSSSESRRSTAAKQHLAHFGLKKVLLMRAILKVKNKEGELIYTLSVKRSHMTRV